MPLGTRQNETGLLNARDSDFSLRRDGGGVWRLDCNPSLLTTAHSLVGKRVRVAGTRAEFDLIDVDSLKAE